MKWDKETDVVVVGYGFAGGVAAITAHDAGARAIILEKSEYPGGCSILAGGGFKFVQDVDKAVEYFTQLSGGRVEDEVIRAFTEGMSRNYDLMLDIAKINGAR